MSKRQRTPKATGRETELVTAIMDALQWDREVIALRINSGMQIIRGTERARRRVFRGAPAGTSDLLCCVRGRFCALEVKTPTGRVTAHQNQFLDRVRASGGFAAVVRSVAAARIAIEHCKEGASQ